MMQVLSTEILHSVDPKDFSLDNYSNNSSIRFFLGVDLDYRGEFYDLDNDYIFQVEKIKVTKEMLSKYQLKIIEDNNFSLGKTKKVVLYLGSYKKEQNPLSKLKIIFKFRVAVKTINRILEFKQRPLFKKIAHSGARKQKQNGNKIKKRKC